MLLWCNKRRIQQPNPTIGPINFAYSPISGANYTDSVKFGGYCTKIADFAHLFGAYCATCSAFVAPK
jgi:hypothetical protein